MNRRTPKEDERSANLRRCSVDSRRKFLKGAGVAIALPTLVSLMPKSLRAQADRPQRLLTLYHPNGTPLSKPDMYARRSEIHPEIRAVFDPVAHRMSVAKNLNGSAYRESIRAWSDHQHMQCYLSLYRGMGLERIGAETKTFDQYIAEDERHQGSRRNSISINLGMQDIDHVNMPPTHFNSASWRGPNDPVRAFADPRQLFEDLFGREGEGMSGNAADEAARRALLERKQLFLDVVRDQVADLRRQVGREDLIRLDEFIAGVRDLDVRTQELLDDRQDIEEMCRATGTPDGVVVDGSLRPPLELYRETLTLMQDLTIRAFQCDLTRVATFHHSAAAGSGNIQRHPWVDQENPTEWHYLSHWEDRADPELTRRDLVRVIQWHLGQMVRFVQALESTPGTWGGTSLLDETLVVAGSSMDHGAHNNQMVRQHLFGTANGAFNEGTEADAGFDEVNGTGKLWLTVLQGFGIDIDTYGTSREILPSLLA